MRAPIVFDRKLYARRRLRAERGAPESFLLHHAGENLAERLGTIERHFDLGLDLGSRGQSFELFSTRAARWVRTALDPASEAISLVTDEEALPFAEARFDLVISVLGLHAVNDLPGALVQIRRSLKPGGLFMAALFGGGTLKELRRAFAAGEAEGTGGTSPHIAPFADVRDMGALLQRAGFVSPVADADSLPVRYRSFATLVEDLRVLGETNALAQRSRRFLLRRILSAALKSYAKNDCSDDKLAATYEILYVTGWTAESSP